MIKFEKQASIILSIFITAFFCRIMYIVVFVEPGYLLMEDQLLYLSLADSIATEGFASMSPERVIGYAMFLSSIDMITPYLISISLIQAFFDSLTCVLIGLLTQNTCGEGFFVAGLISALNLNMIVLSAMVLTDSMFLMLFVTSLLFAIRFVNFQRFIDYVLCIGFLALATTFRSATYYLMPLALVGLAAYGVCANVQLSRVFRYFLAGLGLALLILAPQHLRNWQQYGSTSYVSQSGSHLLGWVVPAVYQYSGKGSYQDGQQLARASLDRALEAVGLSELPADPFISSQFSAKVAMSVMQELGVAAVLRAWFVGTSVNLAVPSAAFAPVVRSMDHPSFYATPGDGALEKLWNYVTDTSGWLYLSILVTGTLTSLVFFMLFVVGWFFALWDKLESGRPALLLLTLILAYFFAVTGPIIGSKYRLPIEPVMTIFVSYAILRFSDRWRVR